MKSSLLIFVLLSVVSTSCGVMFGGSKYTGSVVVKGHPNAEIYYNGNQVGQGQTVNIFPRNRPTTFEVREEGCESKTQTFNNAFRTGNFILSVISWGIIGLGVRGIL